MNRVILIFVLATSLFGCSDHQSPVMTEKATAQMIGLGSPIRLKFDSTEIFLADYFPDIRKIERIEFEGQQLKFDSISGKVILTQKPSGAIGNLAVFCEGIRSDIPVFSSEKLKHHFSYKTKNTSVQTVEISGSMNGWNRKATPLHKEGEFWVSDLILNSGLYQYRIWEDGNEMMDANNPEKIDNGMGAFNNTFFVGEKKGSIPRILTLYADKNIIKLKALDAISHVQVYFENLLIESVITDNNIELKIPEQANKMARSSIRIFAEDGHQRTNDVLIPLANGSVLMDSKELSRKDLNTSIMYFAMVDRFVDGDKSNNRPTMDPAILPQANNLGGDIAGVTQKIKDGYFKGLGINTVWISPVSQNAEGAWGLWNKGVNSKFSAYHGYWPTSLRTIDNRFGTEDQMKELISVAHANDMNVILDYVAHHVHQDHPLIKEKPDWTTPLYLPDGTMNTEKWDEYRLTTWFDTFLPTWKFENHEVVEALTDTAMYWVEHYELDGFRHDATKHINEDFWRTLTKKIKAFETKHPERHIYQIGETYGNPELISSYINSGELDSQFDFNLYDAAVDAFAKDETDFKNLQRVLDESLSYYGNHHLMGNITGNQDRARFTSYADGSVKFQEDAKLAGWTRNIQNAGTSGFEKMAALNAFLMTAPGIPCIYYGDEIGMPGGNDPDNRRMMHFNDFNTSQQKLFDQTTQLTHLRHDNLALTYGDLFVIQNDENAFVYVRSYFGKNVIVAFSKTKGESSNWSCEIPDIFLVKDSKSIGEGRFLLSENKITMTNEGSSAVSFQVFY